MKRDLISILDLEAEDLEQIMQDAAALKALRKEGKEHPVLAGKNLAMIFEKPSTRTRISFEVGMNDLGGHALHLNHKDMQLGRGEEVRDTARVISRYVSGVMIRAFLHSTIQEFAAHATIPVINGLSDKEHPCQLLADIFTIREYFGSTEGIRVAWVGDGNNVCNSLILASGLTGMDLRIATPEEYRPDSAVVDRGRTVGGKVAVFNSPEEAVKDAEVIFTDTWISMGDETQQAQRVKAFAGYTVDEGLLKSADPDAIVMHCLPAHRGQEITDEVLDGPQSAVWDEAENRLHVQKAVLVNLLRT
jgi:ornithine carbamoyltransferase